MTSVSIFFFLLGVLILIFAVFIYAKGEEILRYKFHHLPPENVRKIAQFIGKFWLFYSQIWIVFAVLFNFTQSNTALYIALFIFVLLNISVMIFAWYKIRKMSKKN
jgi:hypothetical protein